jgi:LruC domain-containing protein/choice-of-anchor A domain-containing protein
MRNNSFKQILLSAGILSCCFFFLNNDITAQSPTAPALNFNVFVKNAATFTSSEAEGPVAIGGDLTIGGNYNVSTKNKFSYQVSGVNIGLLVGGKVNYIGGNGLQVLNNGYVKIGNQNGSKAWYLDNNNAASPIRITKGTDYSTNPFIALHAKASDLGNVSATNNPIFASNLIDFTAAFATMQNSALSMSSTVANADLVNPNGDFHSSTISGILNNSPYGQVKINLKSGINTLNVTAAELNAMGSGGIFSFSQNPDATHVLVINVNAPGTFNWSQWNNSSFGGTANCAYILYNFYNTTTLNIIGTNSIEGTVFAPFADINKASNSISNLEGQVIGQSYIQAGGGTITSANFTPTIVPSITKPTTAATLAVFSNVSLNSAKLTVTAGNGTNRVIIVSKTNALNTNPSDATSYTANSIYGSGTAIGNGYVVYNGSGNSVTVSNLTPNTTYYFTVIEYNGTAATATYATSLALSSNTTTLTDTDGDGVADVYDNYPNDANKAFNNYFPASGYATLMYEDMWPSKGDFDFNDFVVDYKFNTVTNAANNVVEINYSFLPRAAGCIYTSGFAFQLDGISADKISSVTGSKATGFTLNSNGTESGHASGFANIPITSNLFTLFNGRSGIDMVNSLTSLPKLTADEISISVKLMVDGIAPAAGTISFSNLGSNVFNPYLFITQDDRGHEIHLADRIPTSKMLTKYFGTGDDKSNASNGVYFKTANNLPWALNVISSIPYPLESKDITKCFSNILAWAVSGGSTNTDWYSDISGYRTSSNLYNK